MNNFYHLPRWVRLREKILRRDGYMCQRCKRYGRLRQATTVHHIKPREDFPALQWDPDNLISLCAACHNAQHPEKTARISKLSPPGGYHNPGGP